MRSSILTMERLSTIPPTKEMEPPSGLEAATTSVPLTPIQCLRTIDLLWDAFDNALDAQIKAEWLAKIKAIQRKNKIYST